MKPDATSADYEQILKTLGIGAAAPASEADIRALAENKLIAILGGFTDPTKNHSDPLVRETALNGIKQKFGIGLEDLVFVPDTNGRMKMILSDEARDKIVAYTKMSAIRHHVAGATAVDTWFGILSNNPLSGAIPTNTRWSEGIGQGGMSSSEDMRTGGGDYIFTHIVHGQVTNGSDGMVYMHPLAASRRLDVHGSNHDNWGGHQANIHIHDLMKQSPSEINWKHGIPRSDLWFVTPPASIRNQLLTKLKANGIDEINGVPIDLFVTLPHTTPPVIDETQWSSHSHPPAITQ